MALTFQIGPNPKWYISDLTGKPLGGGSMFTYRSLDKTSLKFIFQDPAGLLPWTDPVLFDENGAQGPFFWQIDSTAPNETYYIEVYDSAGVLQWTMDHYLPSTGGGGGNITTAIDLENLVANNVLWRNFGASANPIGTTFLKLAPGGHAGLAQTASNAGPDICFIKNNTAAVDELQFIKFPLGSTPLTGDITPVGYLNYVCGNSPVGETQKCVQFPIIQDVQNLTNEGVTVTIWARCNSGNNQLTLNWLQFYGDGAGATPSAPSPIQTLTLSSSWTKYILPVTVPDVSGNVQGPCGNDGLFLQVEYPLGAVTNIDFIKPAVYVGILSPEQDFHTYDMIDAVVNAPRTGHVTQGFDATALFGYVAMNDGSIGKAGSGATTRANIDTFPLYNLLYTNVIDTWAPVSGGRTSDPIADFVAGKTLTLTRQLGRVLGGAGTGSGLTARALGEFLGQETNNTVPAHTHTFTANAADFYASSGTPAGANPGTGGGAFTLFTKAPTGTTGSTGTATVTNMQPSSFMNFFIKL